MVTCSGWILGAQHHYCTWRKVHSSSGKTTPSPSSFPNIKNPHLWILCYHAALVALGDEKLVWVWAKGWATSQEGAFEFRPEDSTPNCPPWDGKGLSRRHLPPAVEFKPKLLIPTTVHLTTTTKDINNNNNERHQKHQKQRKTSKTAKDIKNSKRHQQQQKKTKLKMLTLHHLLLDNNNKNSKRKAQVAHPPAPPSTRPCWSWSANSRQPLHLRSECPPLACSQARPPCHHVPTSDLILRDLTSTVHLSPLSRALFRASAGSTLT